VDIFEMMEQHRPGLCHYDKNQTNAAKEHISVDDYNNPAPKR